MEFKLSRTIETQKFHKHYSFCIGSCHAQMALRHDYVKQLKKLKEDIGIQYVRFHGIFTDDMHTLDTLNNVLDVFPNGEKYVEENFYLIGVAYDNLLECGVKPFVELSFMPELLAKEKSTTKGFYGSNMNEPKNYEEWATYIKHFIEFLLVKYGEEEIKTWYFEVWNEPDLYGAFFKGTQSAYFELYKYTVRAIKSIHPELKVGGPATSASRWIMDFVNYCEREDLPLDFVSTHQYPGDPLIGVSEEETQEKNPNEKVDKLKKNIAKLESMIPESATPLEIVRLMFNDPTETKDIPDNIFRDNAKKTKELVKDLPLFYTEWNLSAVFSANSNDTKKAASYITKTCLDVEPYVDGTSLWCFSDIFEEMHQFKEEFHGGFGLQTLHGIPKPSYYAMKFLFALPQQRYMVDAEYEHNIHIGAFKEEKCDHILISRHSMKTIDAKSERVDISITHGKKVKDIIVKYINDSCCNPLKKWETMGKTKYLTNHEISCIIKETQDKEDHLDFEYHNQAITFHINLELNDVAYIQVIY